VATWIPDPTEPVGPNEIVGRRLFDEPKLIGATDQRAPDWLLDYRHFEDTRGEVSFDRLGRTGRDRKVVNFLRPKAEKAGQDVEPPKTFDGWATVRAKSLATAAKGPSFPLIVSPMYLDQPEHADHNPYHAHAVSVLDAYSMALHLRQIFEEYGESFAARPSPKARGSVPAVSVGPTADSPPAKRLSKWWQWLSEVLRW
jgi:hypothetical protein